jgi:hypothetical protein
MADKKISELVSATTPLAGTEVVEIVQGGSNKKVAVSNFGSTVPDATPTVKGIAKLYTSLGTNTDGAVDQATLKNEIDAIAFEISNVLENEILENGLVWQVANIDGSYNSGTQSQYLRQFQAPVTQNNVTDNFFGLSCGVFQTTAVAGTIAGIRRNDSINLQTFTNVLFIRDFQVDSNISNDCRYIVGLSKNYQFAFPTNNDPSVHTECIYVAKLATSNNLHIVHNDASGTATTIDLGANFPANSDLYKYRFYLTKRSASDYDVKIYRRTLATGVILESSNYNLTTNLPTAGGLLQQILAITNNATATNMRLGDYDLTIKKLPL